MVSKGFNLLVSLSAITSVTITAKSYSSARGSCKKMKFLEFWKESTTCNISA